MKAFSKLLLIFVVLTCALYFFCTAHSVDVEKLALIEVGMPAAQVRKILGDSGELCSYENGTKFISYRKPARWCSVDIILDSNGNVASIFHDH